jgi:hypothetical protein
MRPTAIRSEETGMLDAESIKAKLPDIRGIETLAITIVGDRAVAAFDGRTTSTAHNANEDQMILAIRNSAALPCHRRLPRRCSSTLNRCR